MKFKDIYYDEITQESFQEMVEICNTNNQPNISIPNSFFWVFTISDQKQVNLKNPLAHLPMKVIIC